MIWGQRLLGERWVMMMRYSWCRDSELLELEVVVVGGGPTCYLSDENGGMDGSAAFGGGDWEYSFTQFQD